MGLVRINGVMGFGRDDGDDGGLKLVKSKNCFFLNTEENR